MRAIATSLLAGIAALTVVATVAEAADGCGRGWYYNGRRCVPQDAYGPPPGYGPPPVYGPPRAYGPPPGAYYGPPPPRYSGPPPVYYEEAPPRVYGAPGPQLRLDLGGRNEARYAPPSPAFKTWNNCPPGFTVQDGLCKPYTGR
jgi:hypothetical protein